MRPVLALVCIVAVTAVAAACRTPRITLPTGPGTPTTDFAAPFATALIGCRGVKIFSAALSLSGHVGRQKLRGVVHAGFVPAALRLEGLAPGGGPVFILVADGPNARLLLVRDRRLVDNAPPAEVLDALVGVPLDPDDLRAVLTGCLKSTMEAASGRVYGTDWLVVDLQGGGAAYLRRSADGAWHIVGGSYAGLDIQYGELANAVPSRVMIRSARSGGRTDVDLSLGLSQVEVNGELERDALISMTVPPGTSKMTLDELRESGPLGP